MAIGAAIFIDAGVDGGMTGCAHKCARQGTRSSPRDLTMALTSDPAFTAAHALPVARRSPARFFGPALVFGCRLSLFWLYWSAELFGAVSAALLYKHVFMLPSTQVTITRTIPKEFCQERQLEEVAS